MGGATDQDDYDYVECVKKKVLTGQKMMMKDGWAGRQLIWSLFGTTLVGRGSFLRSKSKVVNSTRYEDREFVRFYNRRTGHTRPMSGRGSGQGRVSYSLMIRIQDL